MSTSKHIDAVCIVVLLLTLLITVLFINGRSLGIEPIVDGDLVEENSEFTKNDLKSDWDTGGATQITLNGDDGVVRGSGAYVYNGDVHILYAGKYVLSGELTDGSVIIEAGSGDKIWLLMNGVSLHCEDSAAVVIEQADKVFMTLAEGTENYISSGAEYTDEAVASGIDGAVYSRDDLTINGSGSLNVTSEYKHAVVCNDDLVITGGKLDITAAEDGLHANDSARITSADITINAGDDGITVSNDDNTAYVYIESGNISIPSCYEGVEAIDITIAGGVLDIRPTDDGINANGWGSGSIIRITGGDVTIINETGRDADGLDSNGDIQISGGNIFISVTADGGSCALDCGSESGGICEISGGTIIAAGSSGMAEGFDSSSEQCFFMHNGSTAAAGTALSIKNEAGTKLFSGEIPCAFSSIVYSSPELQMGEVCTISIGEEEAEITIDNTSANGGFGGPGGMGGGPGGGGPPPGGMGGRPGGRTEASADGTETSEGMMPPSDGAAPADGDSENAEMGFPGGPPQDGGMGPPPGDGMMGPPGDFSGGETGDGAELQGGMQPPGDGSGMPPRDSETASTDGDSENAVFPGGGMMGPPPGAFPGDGTEASGDGAETPEGMMGPPPGDGSEMQPPEDGGMMPPGGGPPPGGGEMGGPPGGPPGDGGMMGGPGGMRGGPWQDLENNPVVEESHMLSGASIVELIIAAAVLILGLAVALTFKRRKEKFK